MTRVQPQAATWGISFLEYKISQVIPGVSTKNKGTGRAVETAAAEEIE
jgi:hypothetical protein